MKTLTLNGDWAIAAAAFAQYYDSFAWDNDTALTAFDFGIEQTLFENLEAEFGAHVIFSSNQVIWSDGTETITLSTDATLSADDTQRSAQITNLNAQNDTLQLTYSSAGQADVNLIWTPTSLTLTSSGQTKIVHLTTPAVHQSNLQMPKKAQTRLKNTKTSAFNQRFHVFRPLFGRHRGHHLIAMEDTQAPLKSPISRHLQCSCPVQ